MREDLSRNKLNLIHQLLLNECKVKIRRYHSASKDNRFVIVFTHETGDIELDLTEQATRGLAKNLNTLLDRMDK